METTIKDMHLSGAIKVFDRISKQVVFSGTEDVIPLRIALQRPVLTYCVDDTLYVDVDLQRVFYDTEAGWYYYESFIRSQYDEHSDEEKRDYWPGGFDEFLAETLKYEPIEEVVD